MSDQPSSAMGGLPERLVEFTTALRSHGITVGTSETVDAASVIGVLGMSDRAMLREGLSAALLRRAGQRDVFDQLFDIHFAAGEGRRNAARDDELTIDEFRDELVQALVDGNRRTVEELAAVAVDRFGALRSGTSGFSAYQALERVQPQTLLSRAVGGRTGDGQPKGHSTGAAWSEQFVADEVRALIATFRQFVTGEAIRRQSEARGRERMSALAVRPSRDRVDFLSANAAQLEELRRSVQPLARRLATRLSSKRRRRNRGKIDIRKTLRKSMGTGGIPMDFVFAKPRPTRPELVLLCDVSGSVSGFSNFTMLLVQAMKSQFSKIRVFAFVNSMDEVTELIEGQGDDLQERIHEHAAVSTWNMNSNYGEAFEEFADRYLSVITPRTSVLILGDARNNQHRTGLDAVKQIAARSRRTFWLNPESPRSWGTDDSIAPLYATVVEMHECRTVEQLSQFVSRLLPV